MSSTAPVKKVSMYLLAGVATDPLFMEGLRQTMTVLLQQDGWLVQSELLYPYGDWSRRLHSQLREMSHDLWLTGPRPLRSIGGRRVAAAIGPGGGADSLPLLIGHSGGGVAAVHAVQILAAARETAAAPDGRQELRGPHVQPAAPLPHRIVQIGSPKCPIPGWMRESVLYAAALGAGGKPSDPVTRIGSWRGWSRTEGAQRQAWLWRRKRLAPGTVIYFPIIGGHPDYFRESSPYVNRDGVSNMETTVQAIRSWFLSASNPIQN